MRSSRRLVEAIDSSLSWTLSLSATAGPSRPRFLSTTSVTAVQARSAGGQSGKSRSAFGIKKLRDGDAQRDDPNFGFGVSKSAAPRSTSRASSRPRRSDVSDIRSPSSDIHPGRSRVDTTDPPPDPFLALELRHPSSGMSREEASDLQWIRIHFSRPSRSDLDDPSISSFKFTPKPSASYSPELPDFVHRFTSPDKIHLIDPYLTSIALALTVPSALVVSLSSATEEKIVDILGAIWFRTNELKRANALAANLGMGGKRTGNGKDKERYRADRDLSAGTAAKCLSRFVAARALRNEEAIVESETSETIGEDREAGRAQRIRSERLLGQLESLIRTYRDRTRQYLIPAPIFALWALLRQEAGISALTKPGEGLRMVSPSMLKLEAAMQELVGLNHTVLNQEVITEEESGPYNEALKGLVAVTDGDQSFPGSLEELDATLADIRVKRENERGVALWQQWRDGAARAESGAAAAAASTSPSQSDTAAGSSSTDNPPSSTSNTGILEPAIRTTVLLSFFRFFARNPRLRKQTTEEEAFAAHRDEILSLFPKPWLSEVHHAVLRYHAKMDEGDLPTADDARALEEESSAPASSQGGQEEPGERIARNREERLEQLKSAWRAAERDKAVDMKMYMLYVEGLGRLGDAEEIREVWRKLGRDERVKEQYRKVEGAKATFPPTSALNHMISAALLIRGTGPAIALDLFHTAADAQSETSSEPASQRYSSARDTTKCNVITINTILRHYASTRNVDGLTATIGLAEKLGLSPDVVTYTTLLQGLLRCGQIDLAKRTMENMSLQGIQPNEHTAGLLISDLVRRGDRSGLLAAEDLMKEMKRLGMTVGVVPWTSLVGGYYRGGWVADAKQARLRMKDHNIELNRVGYNMLLREAGRIPGFTTPPRPASTAPHTRWMRTDETKTALRRLMDQQSSQAAETTVQLHREAAERMATTLLGIFQEMEAARQPRVEANADTYTIMLQALVQHGRYKEAEWVVRRMRENGYTPEKATLRTWVRRVEAWMADQRKRGLSEQLGYEN